MPRKRYPQLWRVVREIVLAHYTDITELSIRGIRGSKGIRGSYYVVGDFLAPLIGKEVTEEDYNWYLTDQGYNSYRDDTWPYLEQQHGLVRPEAAPEGFVFDNGVEYPVTHLERIWDQARGFIFVEKRDEARAIQELSDFGWTIVAGRGYPLRLVRQLLKRDDRPVVTLHDWDSDGKGIYRALGFDTRRTKHLDIALRDRVTDLGLTDDQVVALNLPTRPSPPKYRGVPRAELSALNVLSTRMGLANPVLAFTTSVLASRGVKVSPTELSYTELLERHLRSWLSQALRDVVDEVAEDVAAAEAGDGQAVRGHVDEPIALEDRDAVAQALEATATDLASRVAWSSEGDWHGVALTRFAPETLRGILTGL